MKSTSPQNLDRRLLQICRLYYEQRLSKSEIARQQRMSVTHVSRLLREGQRLGVVEIRVKSPRLRQLEAELVQYFGLRDARVVPASPDRDANLVEIARLGAKLFDEVVFRGARVGIGSGKTLFELASLISERPRELEVYPLNVILEQDTKIVGVTANTSATIIWFRSRPTAHGAHLELFFPESDQSQSKEYVAEVLTSSSVIAMSEQIAQLDIYFVGAGERRSDSQLKTLPESLGISAGSAAAIGDIAFNPVDQQGELVKTGVEDFTFNVELDTLRKHAAADAKRVILVAGGVQKTAVIRAALKASICNVLVTDSEVAEVLLSNNEKGQAA